MIPQCRSHRANSTLLKQPECCCQTELKQTASQVLLDIVRPSVSFPSQDYDRKSMVEETSGGSVASADGVYQHSRTTLLTKIYRRFRVRSSPCISALRKAKSSTLEISQRIINGPARKTRSAARGFLCSGITAPAAAGDVASHEIRRHRLTLCRCRPRIRRTSLQKRRHRPDSTSGSHWHCSGVHAPSRGNYSRSTVTAITIGDELSGPLTSSMFSITPLCLGSMRIRRICWPPSISANSEPGTSTLLM